MMLNDEHTRAKCDVCGKEFDCDTDLHDVGDGRDLCGECFDRIEDAGRANPAERQETDELDTELG